MVGLAIHSVICGCLRWKPRYDTTSHPGRCQRECQSGESRWTVSSLVAHTLITLYVLHAQLRMVTPLSECLMRNCSIEAVRLLVENGADVTALDEVCAVTVSRRLASCDSVDTYRRVEACCTTAWPFLP